MCLNIVPLWWTNNGFLWRLFRVNANCIYQFPRFANELKNPFTLSKQCDSVLSLRGNSPIIYISCVSCGVMWGKQPKIQFLSIPIQIDDAYSHCLFPAMRLGGDFLLLSTYLAGDNYRVVGKYILFCSNWQALRVMGKENWRHTILQWSRLCASAAVWFTRSLA